MFAKSAEWYDLLYGFKDYEKDARTLFDWLEKTHPTARTILDVACGSGEHDRHLAARYAVDGLDLVEAFLEIARTKNPAGRYVAGDMADFDLGRRYDVILCLFSSIGYVRTTDRLAQAFRCFRKHVKDDGIVIVEPWIEPEKWQSGKVDMSTAEAEGRKVCRMALTGAEGRISWVLFHYLMGANGEIRHETERHELGLFSREEMLSAFREAGFDIEHSSQGLTGRGVYMARPVSERRLQT
jgi:SAM-dependent methyltransferase